jgi:hypothetical protein
MTCGIKPLSQPFMRIQLGWYLGRGIPQNIAVLRPKLVRKLVIVGSGARNGDGIPLTPEAKWKVAQLRVACTASGQ